MRQKRLKIAANDIGNGASKAAKDTKKAFKKAFSDRRLKENINLVGNSNGLNVYEYNYTWSSEKQKGVMAQELLETKYSDAVSTHKSGYYMVDYSKLPTI
jgi:hypothetical protein